MEAGCVLQICGNVEGAEALRQWLQAWRPDVGTMRGACQQGASDSESEWFQDSNAATSTESEVTGHGAMWICGPTGCGKTAAVYAVAQVAAQPSLSL